MTKRLIVFLLLGIFLHPSSALAEPVRSLWNGTGTGGFHVPGGEVREGQGAATILGAYTNQGGLLAPGDEVTRSRYGLAGQYAPLPYLELGIAVLGNSIDVEPSGTELDSFGDFVLAAKGAYRINETFSTGLRGELRLFSGVGGPEGTESGYGDTASYAGEWVSTARFGSFAVHGMVGYLYDRTVNFTEGVPTPAERFAWGQTDYNQVLYGLGFNFETDFADYVVELSGAQPVGDGAPALSESPLRVTPGLRLRPWGPLELQLGADFSLTDEAGQGVPAQPNYDLLAALRFQFGGAREEAESEAEALPAEEEEAPAAPAAEEPVVAVPPPPVAAPAQTGAISGKVVHEKTGQAVADAKITVEGLELSATSNQEGNYLLAAVPAGAVRLNIEAPGMEPYTTEVSVSANAAVTVNAQVKPQSTEGKLSVRALDAAGKPIEGVDVRVNGESKGATDAEGLLEILGMSAGMQEVALSKAGYRTPDPVFVEVVAGQTSAETVTMQAEPRPGFVEVKVVNTEREPIAATVTVEGHPEWTRQLDPAAGSVATLKVPPGTYRFRAEAPGYQPEVQQVVIEEDDEEAVRFKLSK
jgi:hypothetical protein